MNAPEPLPPQEDLPLVLLVDDEVRSLQAMSRTLDEDFRILTASDAEAARALLERHTVAVILCDQRMPGCSGVDFLKQVRARWPDAVRAIITGRYELGKSKELLIGKATGIKNVLKFSA